MTTPYAFIGLAGILICGLEFQLVDSSSDEETTQFELQDSKPTYWNDIEPIIRRKCLACHVRDGHGPFSLSSYAEVKKRIGLIRTVAIIHSMPPTIAESDLGQIPSQARLTDSEVLAIQEWWSSGAPEGSKTSDAKSVAPIYSFTRSIRVFDGAMARAEGRPYWVAIGIPSSRSLRISGFRILAKSPRAIRHVLLAKSTSNPYPVATETLGFPAVETRDLIGTWGHGYPNWSLPKGSAVFVDKGDTLVLQLQVHPTGKQENLEVELQIQEDIAATQSPHWVVFKRDEFVIPKEERIALAESHRFERPFEPVAAVIEARFFATQVHISALRDTNTAKRQDVESRDAKEEPTSLLFITKWQPFWMGNYVFPKGNVFPAGTVLTAQIDYDNGKHSGNNEGRVIGDVRSGASLDDEQFKVYLQVVDR